MSTPSPPQTVLYEVVDRTAVITLHRPEARNAVDGRMARELEAAVDRAEADDAVWTGVLAATGDVFCAGADLKVLSQGRDAELFTERGNFGGFVRLERAKPMIAAVDGPALAGGCEFALACDLVVASTRATFGQPEVKRALVAAAGGLVRLPRLLPRALAMKMLLTGDPISAEEAHRHGLVAELVEPGRARDAALELAASINANAPLAVRETLRLAGRSADTDPVEVWRASRRAMNELARTNDFREGPRAFVEKRPPEWTGT